MDDGVCSEREDSESQMNALWHGAVYYEVTAAKTSYHHALCSLNVDSEGEDACAHLYEGHNIQPNAIAECKMVPMVPGNGLMEHCREGKMILSKR